MLVSLLKFMLLTRPPTQNLVFSFTAHINMKKIYKTSKLTYILISTCMKDQFYSFLKVI